MLCVMCVNSSVLRWSSAELIVDLLMLAVDPAEQRRDFVVGLRLERMIQINGVERLDNAAGESFRQKRAENHSGEQNDQHRLDHAKQQHSQRLPRDTDAKHAPVVHALCDVDRLFKKRLQNTGLLSPSPVVSACCTSSRAAWFSIVFASACVS